MPASPLLLLVPYRYKAAVLYSQIPISASASGDFVVSRAGNTASRILGNGNIETGVLANIARINYPRTGVASGCAGLLVEPSAANAFIQSQTLFTSHLVQNLTTAGYENVAISPDGTQNAEKFVPNNTNGVHGIADVTSQTITSGTTYTFSCFAKSDGGTNFPFIALTLDSTAAWGATKNAIFNVVSGTIHGSAPSGVTMRIENYGSGWYRFSATATAVGSVTGTFQYRIYVPNSSASLLPYAAASGNTEGVLVWGAQLEVGSVATSYIPTTTGTVTRNSDVITNNQFVIPNLIGAILTEFESPTSGTYFVDNLPVTLVSGYNKVAISYTPTTITVYRNGTQVSGSPFSPPGGVLPILGNVINIGHNNQYYQLGANIRSFVLYSSTLTAAEASGLTT